MAAEEMEERSCLMENLSETPAEETHDHWVEYAKHISGNILSETLAEETHYFKQNMQSTAEETHYQKQRLRKHIKIKQNMQSTAEETHY